MIFISDFIKSRYWRAVIIGATTTPDNSWRVFLLVFVNLFLIPVFIFNAVLEPDPNHWRAYAAWGITMLLFLFLPLNIISIHSYYNRKNINLDDIDPKFRKNPDLGKEFSIGMAAVIMGPPIIRYFFGLFGIEI